jgi:cytoskeleton protein RodZ
MANEVGAVLREARNRRKVDLSEVEATTRIRVRYLRAIENEEWDVLPGEVYARGFIRTYAAYLGLDGERLAEDHRRSVEAAAGARGPSLDPTPVAVSPPKGPSELRQRLPGAGWLVGAAVILLAIAAIVAIPDGGGESGPAVQQPPRSSGNGGNSQAAIPPKRATANVVSVSLAASAEVWVCMLDGKGEELVDGQILEAGAEEGPFRSGSFIVSLGNGEVSMLIDGKEAEIPATSSPIGYSIDASGTLTQLDEAERPTCA